MQDEKQILRARAQALARELPGEPAADEKIDVVEFVLCEEHYAIRLMQVCEVLPLKDLTELPCTPAFVAGIINRRGQILSVIDLRKLFELPCKPTDKANQVVVIDACDMQTGILADSIAGVHSIHLADLQAPLPTMTGVRGRYLRGITPDLLAVLDAERILRDGQIWVHDRASPAMGSEPQVQ